MTIDLTENEANVVLNAIWIRLYGSDARQNVGRYRNKPAPLSERERALDLPTLLQSAHDKIHAALPPVKEFADNH